MASDDRPKIPPDAMRYITVGIEFICIFGVFLVAGLLLDRRLDTKLAFTMIGMVVGFACAMYRLVRVGRELRDRDKHKPDKPDK